MKNFSISLLVLLALMVATATTAQTVANWPRPKTTTTHTSAMHMLSSRHSSSVSSNGWHCQWKQTDGPGGVVVVSDPSQDSPSTHPSNPPPSEPSNPPPSEPSNPPPSEPSNPPPSEPSNPPPSEPSTPPPSKPSTPPPSEPSNPPPSKPSNPPPSEPSTPPPSKPSTPPPSEPSNPPPSKPATPPPSMPRNPPMTRPRNPPQQRQPFYNPIPYFQFPDLDHMARCFSSMPDAMMCYDQIMGSYTTGSFQVNRQCCNIIVGMEDECSDVVFFNFQDGYFCRALQYTCNYHY